MDLSPVSIDTGGAAFKLFLPDTPDDPVVRAYARGEALNEYLIELLRLLLPKPGTVLDVGCHVGTFTLAAAALGHRVVAIDAVPDQCKLVEASAEENGFNDVTVIHSAVSDRSERVRFAERGLFGGVVLDGAPGTEVRAEPIPALLSEVGVSEEEIDFIKIDIEGSELRAFRGAAAWLSSDSAPPILYESNPRTSEPFGYSVDGLRTALMVLGYESYRPEPDGLFRCPPGEPQPEGWTDVLALKDSHLAGQRIQGHGPIPEERLVAKFDYWSQDPDPGIRAYVADELIRHWPRFKDNPLAETIRMRLSGDQGEFSPARSAMPRRFARLRNRINVRRAKIREAISRRR